MKHNKPSQFDLEYNPSVWRIGVQTFLIVFSAFSVLWGTAMVSTALFVNLAYLPLAMIHGAVHSALLFWAIALRRRRAWAWWPTAILLGFVVIAYAVLSIHSLMQPGSEEGAYFFPVLTILYSIAFIGLLTIRTECAASATKPHPN